MIDLHSAQIMSAASWPVLSFAYIMSKIIGCTLSQVSHQMSGKVEGVHGLLQQRPHQGRWCFGKTPMQTFLDAMPMAKEKMSAA